MLGCASFSSIAAAGASAAALSVSLELPPTTPTSELVQLLDGLDEICDRFGARVMVGSIKERPALAATSTAIGVCPPDRAPVRRTGAAPGDVLCVIGPLGDYWSTTLLLRNGHDLPATWGREAVMRLRRPLPQLRAGAALAARGISTCAMANSDGLYTVAAALGAANGLGVVLDFAAVTWPLRIRRFIRNGEVRKPAYLKRRYGEGLNRRTLTCGSSLSAARVESRPPMPLSSTSSRTRTPRRAAASIARSSSNPEVSRCQM